ncbi:MAG: NYN domain-containing protein, partial [Acidobacteriota bacterium]
MNDSNEERLKIAVFIDFDNIAIGVKQSLGRNFDVGTVLEAIKEKGQVVTKIAYGDWKRNEDFSRAMTQHAVQMVQRNLTPGGDKNGADIALALDALEMAFTRDHINAFVIVGGDSDFIALVEKLKQYDKVVFIVGGRAFTSVILQKNCHEFISYENLIGVQSGGRRSSGRQQMLSSPAPLETALPLIRRSLKILSDREVSPQLGLLKSTLLQLDSTFSERDYGVSSFRDFMQKLANAGFVHLKQVDRSLLVELKDLSEADQKTEADASAGSNILSFQANSPSTETSATPGLPAEATISLQELIRESKTKPRWPLYLRSFKQFLRSLQPPFDERQFGITSTYDLVRQAQKDGLLHVERNRQGILRIYPGELLKQDIESP